VTPMFCRQARKAAKWSQERLADLAGLDRTTVSRYERGFTARLQADTASRLQAVFERAGFTFMADGVTWDKERVDASFRHLLRGVGR
jgi:transcriptional regulator with XRE-family HTH domain